MSEDEETKCKLTYREGMHIIEHVEKPFDKANWAVMIVMVFAFAAFVGMLAYDNAFPPEPPEEILDAGFTPNQASIIMEEFRVALYMGIVMGGMLGGILMMVGLTALRNGITRIWLKAANEEEKE